MQCASPHVCVLCVCEGVLCLCVCGLENGRIRMLEVYVCARVCVCVSWQSSADVCGRDVCVCVWGVCVCVIVVVFTVCVRLGDVAC